MKTTRAQTFFAIICNEQLTKTQLTKYSIWWTTDCRLYTSNKIYKVMTKQLWRLPLYHPEHPCIHSQQKLLRYITILCTDSGTCSWNDEAYLPRIWRIWRFWSRIFVSARSTFGAIRSSWSFCAAISSPRPTARSFRRVTPVDICSTTKCWTDLNPHTTLHSEWL